MSDLVQRDSSGQPIPFTNALGGDEPLDAGEAAGKAIQDRALTEWIGRHAFTGERAEDVERLLAQALAAEVGQRGLEGTPYVLDAEIVRAVKVIGRGGTVLFTMESGRKIEVRLVVESFDRDSR